MRRSFFNVITIVAGAVLVAALGVSAHAQLSGGLTRAGVHGQQVTLHTERAEVATEARDNEPVEVPEQEQAAPEVEAPDNDNEAADNDNEAADNDNQGDDNDHQGGDNGGDSHDDGGGD